MNSGEGNQVMVGIAVHDTLQHREKYMKTFRKYQAKIKHGTLEVFQFIEGGHAGLNTDIPAQFQPREIGEAKLSIWAAYYLAHALKLQDVISKYTNSSGAADTWAVILWLLAADSAVIKGRRPFESATTRFWKAPSGNILDSFKHYSEADWVVMERVREDLEYNQLKEFQDCFERPTFFYVHFVSEEGKRKLKGEHPDIWQEFGFGK
jgi:hypothetical protein